MFWYKTILLGKGRFGGFLEIEGSIEFDFNYEILRKVKIFTKKFDTQKQNKFWSEVIQTQQKSELINVPLVGAGSLIYVPSEIIIYLGFLKEVKNIDIIFAYTLMISDILSSLMPFSSYCDIPERLINKKDWQFGGPLRDGYIPKMNNFGFNIKDICSEDYLIDNKKLLNKICGKIKKYNYLKSSLRLAKDSKKALLNENDVSKSIALLVSAIENLYLYEQNKKDLILQKKLKKYKSKSKKFSKFLEEFLDIKNCKELSKIDWYSIRSEYLHDGKFLEFPNFWIDYDNNNLKIKNEEYNKYFVGLQLIFNAFQEYIKL